MKFALWGLLLLATLTGCGAEWFPTTTQSSTVTITTANLPGGTVGTDYSGGALTATGGTPPYTWAATGLSAIGATMTIDTNSGTITGKPTTSGTFPVTVVATDSSTAKANGNKTFNIVITAAGTTAAQVIPVVLPEGSAAVAYSHTLTCSSGTAPYSWAVASGTIPEGLALSAAGVISGTPVSAGSYTFTATASDAKGIPFDITYTLTVR